MDLSKISKGKDFPNEVNVVIEVPAQSPVKYEFDKDAGAVVVDRFMYTAMAYPFNYGFVPHTHADDGDPVDVLVLSSHPVQSGSVIAARPIGVLEMEDEAGIDHKVLAVPTKKIDPFYADVEDIKDLNETLLGQIKHFFEHYKELEPNKWVKVKEFKGGDAAREDIQKAAE